MSLRAIRVLINPRAWRQLAIGIAIKKFLGIRYLADTDLPEDVDDDLNG